MRTLVALALLAACGKQLNAQYCAQNPMDTDCKNAGLTVIDAPTACTSDPECPGQVCDTVKGECVECVMGDEAACGTGHCGLDDHCHQCITDAQCGAGGVCLPDLTCLSNDSFRYAAPAPTGAGTACTSTAPCTLTNAIASLDATHRAISVAAGDYHEGPLTITKNAVLIGQGTGGDPALTRVTLATGGTGAVITVNGTANVAIDYMTVYGGDTDGIACAGGTLTFHRSNSFGNGAHGISSGGNCVLNVDRAQIYSNGVSALFAQSSTLQIVNNFMFDNGQNNQDGGAVRLGPATTGSVAYNSIAYNHYKNPSDGALTCDNGGAAAVDFNILAGNTGKVQYTRGGCEMSFNYVANDANPVAFKSKVAPYDLHLTATTPTQTQNPNVPIRDNSNTTCVMKLINLDIDGDARPFNTFCDLGADEYQ